MKPLLIASTFALLGFGIYGCSETTDTVSTDLSEANRAADAELGVSQDRYRLPPPSYTCPVTLSEAQAGQKNTNGLFQYIFLGGPTPAVSATTLANATTLKALAASGNYKLDDYSTTAPPVTSRCSISSAYYRAQCYLNGVIVSCKDVPGAWDAVSNLLASLDTTSQVFVYSEMTVISQTANSVYSEVKYYWDPSIARLTANLSGSTGASASAALYTDGSATTVRKWPSSWTSCSSNCPTAGTICSTGDLLSGQDAVKHIAVNGAYIQCI